MSENTENYNNFCLKSVKRFAKILIIIPAIFVVFTCGFATLVMQFGKELEPSVFALVCCLAGLPLIVFSALIIIFYKCINPKKNNSQNYYYTI